MKYKKTITIFIIFLFFSIFNITINKIKPTTTNIQYNYIIKDYNGAIAVFDVNDEEKPIIEYDIFLSNLPKDDIGIIKNGVKKMSLDEVNLFMQDYL